MHMHNVLPPPGIRYVLEGTSINLHDKAQGATCRPCSLHVTKEAAAPLMLTCTLLTQL